MKRSLAERCRLRPPTPQAPPFFTAIKEQLGLELEATRGNVQALVIDHAETPTAN